MSADPRLSLQPSARRAVSWSSLLSLPVCLPLFVSCVASHPVEIDGAMQRWHPITLTFEGPQASEDGSPNPFRDYRLTVAFTHSATGSEHVVPGYFATDGDAAETSATAGTKWRVHFTPHETGWWTFAASFRAGPDVALGLEPEAGTPSHFDGASGSFQITESDKTGRDHRGKGMLRYVGESHLRFDDGTYFVKGGADSPENLLAYGDFDDTYSLADAGQQRSGEAPTAPLHRYEPHAQDWNPGDPTWKVDRGKNLIGALNYLAGKGVNAFSFLTMNVGGDGKDVWPWIAPDVRDRFDVSKLAQWDVVFTHADSLGLFLHFKTQETEIDLLLDNGDLGPERRLYYRELIARFAHHHALNWNLGEENNLWEERDDPTQVRIKEYIAYIQALDPYDHPVVIHTYPGQQEQVYRPLLGDASGLNGVSIQTEFDNVHRETLTWVQASADAGRRWVVANDEQGHYTTGVKPDGPDSNRDAIRQHTLWGNLMAGGAGVEYYFGYEYPHNDLNCEDWRSRDRVWDDVRHALTFFEEHLPFWEMTSNDVLASEAEAHVLVQPQGTPIAVYLPRGAPVRLDLRAYSGTYTVHWYDPRRGGALQAGSLDRVDGGRVVALGQPPAEADGDWVVLVRRELP
ncbi:MAG: DUF5060 domain-containing protein [Gemmatimonadota bacterium]|nr:MAG: DUF5060 domain-containing protein [Gemmatimonadota bacterium]